MFDIDSGKLLIVAVLALIVIGPKELPRVLRQVGQAVGKLRRMAGEFQGQFMDAMKEADVADIRKELDELNKSAALDVHFDPARDIHNELSTVMRPLSATADAKTTPSATDTASTTPSFAAETPVVQVEQLPVIEAEVLDDAPTVPGLLDEPPFDSSPFAEPDADFLPNCVRRKIHVKRRTSRLNVLQTDAVAATTGEPFRVRRRPVRVKVVAGESLPTS